MSVFDQLPTLVEELSRDELTQIKKKILILYDEASKFHSDFTKLEAVSNVTAITVFKDYTNAEYSLKDIGRRNNLEPRVIAQIFADRLLQDGIQCLKQINPLRILKEYDIDRPLLLDLAILLRTVTGPSTIFICSINGLCISVSQLIISLALVNTYLNNPEISEMLRIHFDCVENSSNLMLLNPQLIISSLLAEEGKEREKAELSRDLLSAINDDLKTIKTQSKNIDGPLQSMHNFDFPVGEFLKLNPSKTIDQISNGLKELEKNRIRHYLPPASDEELYEMLFPAVKPNMEVYVNVQRNNDQKYLYGRIQKIINDHLFEIKLNAADYEHNKVFKVNRTVLALGKAKDCDFPIGTRVIAFFKPRNRTEQRLFTSEWWTGTIAKESSRDGNQEYLIFFDCDQEAYVSRKFVRLHFDQAVEFDEKKQVSRVSPFDNYSKSSQRKEFLQYYLYTSRNISLHTNNIGTTIAAKNNRKVYQANILDIDRELFLLRYNKTDRNTDTEPGRGCTDVRCYKHTHFDEWVYRGSTSKLNAPEESRRRGRRQFQKNTNISTSSAKNTKVPIARKSTASVKLETSRSGSVFDEEDGDLKEKKEKAKKVKMTSLTAPIWQDHFDAIYHSKHGPECLTKYVSIIKSVSKEICPKVTSPYFYPLLNGWTRKVISYSSIYSTKKKSKSYVVYEAPCGASFHNFEHIEQYLHDTNSPISIFFFDFSTNIRPEVICKEFYPGSLIDPDYAMGMEAVPIPVVNAVDPSQKPKMVYNIARYSRDEKIHKMLQEISHQTVCFCECTDDCSDPTKCACQQLTYLEHARMDEQLQAPNPLYLHGCVDYRVQSGIYECNGFCHCNKKLCYNYVAQRKVVIPLQLFQTPQSGWGVRTLVDIPKGTFISTYSGEILDNALAEDLKHSDAYFCETDLIEDFENVKIDKGLDIPDEGVEIDMPISSGPKEGIELTKFFEDDLTFIVDAFDEGNIGRFYNHSCDPNMFVQNVFTDTHDLRLPSLAFFSACEVKAGTELTWDYGYTSYDRKIRCHCGTSKCRTWLM